jgi:hypothetical protein
MKEKREKDPKRVASGRRSRNKGRANEQQVAITIGKHFGCSVESKDKFLPSHYLQHIRRTARDRQVGIGDIWTSESLRKVFNWIPECKDYGDWNIETLFGEKNAWFRGWWSQTVEQSVYTSQPPLLIFTKSFAPQYVCFRDVDTPLVINATPATILSLTLNDDKLTIMRLTDFLVRYYDGINIINS